jgi:hypothetical protein
MQFRMRIGRKAMGVIQQGINGLAEEGQNKKRLQGMYKR